MLDPCPEIGEHLVRCADGYWVAPGSAPVSYPAEGNQACFAVEDESFWFRHRNAVITRLLHAYPPAGRIFDIGGGNGAVALAIQQAGHPVVLVEPGPTGARNAVARGLEQVVCATLEGAGFRPASLPAAGLFDVIEHVEDDQRFLETVSGFLVPGGRLYLTVPAYGWLWSDEDRTAGHFRRYSRRSLERLLARAGFEPEYVSYLFSLLPAPILLLRALPSRLRRAAPDAPLAISRREHAPESRLVAQLLDAFGRLECHRVARGRRIPFGSSLVAVARVGAAG